jgi:predicted nucleic acid-binding protein
LIVIVDSFAWIEFLGGTSLEPAVRKELAAAEVVVTPDLVLAEVARKLARDGVSRPVALRKLGDISTLSEVTPIGLEIALGVAEADDDLRRSAKSRGIERPGLADAVILSTTRTLRGKVLTGDGHFHGFPETIWLGP